MFPFLDADLASFPAVRRVTDGVSRDAAAIAWVAGLRPLIAELTAEWHLSLVRPLSGGSNSVVFDRRRARPPAPSLFSR